MAEKDEFIRRLHEQIDEWDKEIERLMAKAAEMEAESREQYYEQMAELKSRRAEFEEKLERLQKSGEEAWKDLQTGLEMAALTLGETLRSALSRFK